MQTNKIAIVLLSTILALSMILIGLAPMVAGDAAIAPGTHLPTYAHLNIYPNPAGVGQQVTFGIFLASPYPTNEPAKPFYVIVTNPSGSNTTLGPYTSDLTGGTVAYYTPDAVGNYSVQFIFGGQDLTNSTSFQNLHADASQSDVQTLVVQQEMNIARSLPFTPLPTQWWQIPVTAENSQNWYQLTGSWLGLGANSFSITGSYNASGYTNPYTESVTSGHILWTKPWLAGGVAGGIFGGDETRSHYWSTFQYQPRYSPVIIDGKIYSNWATFTGIRTTTIADQGISCVDMYTGQTLWTINTTSILRCGMQIFQYTINDYGVRGPWLWATGVLPASEVGGNIPSNNTGTQWNLYDGFTGKYCMSVVNGTDLTLGQDTDGNLIGYFLNNTAGTQIVHPRFNTNAVATNTGPHITAVNMTVCAGFTGSNNPQGVQQNAFRAMQTGYMWDMPVQTNISGVDIDPNLSLSSITGGCLVLTAGSTSHGTHGYMTFASMDAITGQQLAAVNVTYPGAQSMLPYTRTISSYGNGIISFGNDQNFAVDAYNVADGSKAWSTTLVGTNGAAPNVYDLFQMKPYWANGLNIWTGLGGDVWAINGTTGQIKWYGNTTQWQGSSGLETPYNVWPIWVFTSSCFDSNMAYLGGGHEYNPPLFHGSQIYAVNLTDGSLVWQELDCSVTSTAIAYGKLVTLNAYDNQLYCMGKGPSGITLNAPSIGVTTSTPITITGTVLDFSPGVSQQQTKSNYPYGLPCVSDASQSDFMEAVYQQQVMPNNITGVPITLSVIDANNNLRDIGSTTSDAAGTFAFTWTPDITGAYTLIAHFQGSNSYYPSSAQTHFFAGETPTHAPTTSPQAGVATTADLLTYMAAGVVAIIIAIALVGLVLYRKH